ncbi:hypothetical protein ASPZODRAFT_32595, partial [Penicilliopsis zonata CBS 506.65]
PQFTFKKRSAKAKANFRKKPDTPPPASESESAGFTSSDDDEGRRIKRRRKNVAVTASSATNPTARKKGADSDDQPTSVAPVPLTSSNDATKAANWYDEDLSEQNLLGTTRASTTTTTTTTTTTDGMYKGTSNYQSFIQKNPNAPTKQFGPMKAATNVRTVTVMDYAPDVCKDWKITGYCGYGDSCKYLHSRETYKQGWEIDREWEVNTKGKQLKGKIVSTHKKDGKNGHDDDDDDDDEEDEEDELLESIPFACIICKKPYQNPIVTKCGHYFCESCALQRYRKNPSCAACGTGTSGVFNVAKKLNDLLEKKRERARRRREKAIAEGEEPSEGESD